MVAKPIKDCKKAIEMKKNIVGIMVMLILTACATTDTPPTPIEVLAADTMAPSTMTPLPPTSDPAADWQEYVNTELGYSFRYPAECSFGPMGAECKKDPPEERPLECLCFLDAEDPLSVLMQSLFSMQGEEFTMLTFTVSQYDTPAFNPPESEEWIPWFKDNWSYLSEDIPDESNMTLGGWPAVRIYSPGSPQANSAENIFVLKNGKLIQIMMIDVDVPELRERYETILSTFEFYD